MPDMARTLTRDPAGKFTAPERTAPDLTLTAQQERALEEQRAWEDEAIEDYFDGPEPSYQGGPGFISGDATPF